MGCWNTCIFLVYVCTIGVSQTSKALRGPPCFGDPVLGVKFLGVWSVLVLIKSAFRTFIWDSRATCNDYIRCKMFFFFFLIPQKNFWLSRDQLTKH